MSFSEFVVVLLDAVHFQHSRNRHFFIIFLSNEICTRLFQRRHCRMGTKLFLFFVILRKEIAMHRLKCLTTAMKKVRRCIAWGLHCCNGRAKRGTISQSTACFVFLFSWSSAINRDQLKILIEHKLIFYRLTLESLPFFVCLNMQLSKTSTPLNSNENTASRMYPFGAFI